jgi:hypothetical protein
MAVATRDMPSNTATIDEASTKPNTGTGHRLRTASGTLTISATKHTTTIVPPDSRSAEVMVP